MSLALLNTIILRETVDAPYTTKASELLFAELDANIIILADAIREVSEGETPGIQTFDPGTEYSNTLPDFVNYDNNTWEYVNAIPSTGVTPGTDPTTWAIASKGLFSHQQNTDTYLAFGTTDEVSAADLKVLVDNGPVDESMLLPLDGSRFASSVCIGANNMGLAPLEVTGTDATTDTGGVATSYGGFFFTNNADTTLLVRTLGSGHAQISTDGPGRFISFATGLFDECLRLTAAGAAKFPKLTASTVVYLNSSKELVSLPNGAGVLTNDGAGNLSWV